MAFSILGGLKGLPREPLEAAIVDGASRWQIFRYLTLPFLKPVIVVILLVRMIDAFRILIRFSLLQEEGQVIAPQPLLILFIKSDLIFIAWEKGQLYLG